MSTPGYACPSVVFWTLRKYTKLNKKQPGICLSVRHWPPANGARIGPFGKEENPYTWRQAANAFLMWLVAKKNVLIKLGYGIFMLISEQYYNSLESSQYGEVTPTTTKLPWCTLIHFWPWAKAQTDTDLASDGGEVSIHGVVGGRRGGSVGGALVLSAVLSVCPLGLAPHLAHGVPGHRVTLVVGHALVGHPWHRCTILRERERERERGRKD